MTLIETEDHIGERLYARRMFLDKTQRQIADEVGISHSTLGRLEKGHLPSNNRFIIARLAKALKCSTEYLTGVAVPGGTDKADIAAATYDSVNALLAADLEFTPNPATGLAPVAALTERVAAVIDMRQKCEYAQLARRLPALVRDLYDATTGPDREQVLALLVRVAEAASFAVRFLGDPRSASIASDRARQAAQAVGDAVLISFGEWARAHTALGCGLHERAALIADKAIRDLNAAPEKKGRTEMLGMLSLTLAFAQVGAGRISDAQAPLEQARQLARITGETDTLALMFGPTNVQFWELSLLTDGGDPVDAMPLLERTNPKIVMSASRQAVFYIDGGRLLAKAGHTDRAVAFFETAERVAPQRVHGDPLTRESIRGMLDTVRRNAVSTRLRGLASRAGMPA